MDEASLDKASPEELTKLVEEKNISLQQQEQDLADKTEELLAQKEELTAAIEELMAKNQSLSQALNQLRDRNFELDQILYRTSHDLRAPLSSIKGILNLLKTEPQSDVIRQYGAHIENKTSQMDNLLSSLSSLSKAILEQPSITMVDLNQLVLQATNEMRHLPAWQNVDVIRNLQQEKVKTDSFLILIILQSLLSNAFIFRDPAKRGIIKINFSKSDATFNIEVIDDGEGISAPILHYIFDMFYRGSEKSLGNGLGLYVAKKAVEQLGGRIRVQSEEVGSRFTVNIPLIN